MKFIFKERETYSRLRIRVNAMKSKNVGMGLMCFACCAVPLSSILIGSGMLASTVAFLGSHDGLRGISIMLGFGLIGSAGFSIWRRGNSKTCSN